MPDRIGAMEVVLSAEAVRVHVEDLAGRLAPRIDESAIGLTLLLGGMWFAADLTRALARRGRRVASDALWLASYGDGRTSSGACQVRAAPQRSLEGVQVLIMDDVIDTGLSLAQAAEIALDLGAREVIAVVFARKPWPSRRAIEPDDFAWDAPARFLVGYGMDLGGRLRDLPYIAAAD
ncbi:MAG TPA: phosphoribosyltransferase family protein [Caulobacteraceae bacterium]|jgi:hypoxanthine phosphoribosyltransferase|nr:phosphoribosyltransferase family protein [Caulobacteraceae bacterium]